MDSNQGTGYGGSVPGAAWDRSGEMNQGQQSSGAGLSVQQAQDSAGKVADKAKQQVVTQLAGQKDRASGMMSGMAEALRQAGQTLQEKGSAPVAGYVNGAADQVDRAARYLSEKDISELQADATRLARERPVMLVAGAFALGFLGARFFKSSSPSQYSGGSTGGGYGYSLAGPGMGAGSAQQGMVPSYAAAQAPGYTDRGDLPGTAMDAGAPSRGVSDVAMGTYRE